MDLDGDGRTDLLSGSWPGEIYFFKRLESGEFAAPIKLKHPNGEFINVGHAVRQNGSMVIVTGDAQIEREGTKVIVTYGPKRYEYPKGTRVATTGCAAAVWAADWDADGDFDLLIGDIQGRVWLVVNEGTPREPVFGKPQPLTASGEPVQVGGDAGPAACDWDGDGDLDLLVGADDGSVWLFENVGTRNEPKLTAGVQIIGPGKWTVEDPNAVARGARAKICPVDWNGDGLVDLLVGDFLRQRKPTKALSDDEQRRIEELRKRVDEALEEYQRISRQYAEATDPEEKARLERAQEAALRRYAQLFRQLPQQYEYHGHVWLFLRKKP